MIISNNINNKILLLKILLFTVTSGCKRRELISGDHWVPNSAFKASSVRDKDSGPENSRIDWTAAGIIIHILLRLFIREFCGAYKNALK